MRASDDESERGLACYGNALVTVEICCTRNSTGTLEPRHTHVFLVVVGVVPFGAEVLIAADGFGVAILLSCIVGT